MGITAVLITTIGTEGQPSLYFKYVSTLSLCHLVPILCDKHGIINYEPKGLPPSTESSFPDVAGIVLALEFSIR